LNTSHQTIGWFADQSSFDRLELRPPFQRRPVWTNEEKSFLIDSILREYPVPEIYTYTYSGSDGQGDVTAVVDGQQRLRACLEYMTDGYSVSFDLNKLRPMYSLDETPWYGKRFSGLEQSQRDTFRRYKLIVRELEDVTEQEIRHMFHRLNQSTFTLNSQELRYSMYAGGLLGCVEALAKLKQWEQIGMFTIRQRRRMLDSEYISELVVGYLHWPQNKKDNLEHFYRQYAEVFPAENEVKSLFSEVLDFLLELFPKRKMSGTRWYQKSDFYTLFLAVARGQIVKSDSDVLREQLTTFSALVSGDEFADDRGPIGVYKAAVSRAATDRTRRMRREEALIAYLSGQRDELRSAGSDEDDIELDDDDDGEYEDEAEE
jgi:hypothetical protein